MRPFHAEAGSRITAGVILEPHDDQVMIVRAMRTYYEGLERPDCQDAKERLDELDMIEVKGGFNGPIVISTSDARAAVEVLQRQAETERPAEARYLRVISAGLTRAHNDSVLYYLNHREKLGK